MTGEGTLDWQSLRGKVVSGVAAVALAHGRPVVVLAGQVQVVFGVLPKTSTGKIQKFVLREQVKSASAMDT